MVLSLTAILFGGAIGMIIFSSDERVLRDTSGEIELLAKRARTMSILKQIPYALEFREDSVRLLPYAQAGQIEKRSSRSRQSGVTEDELGENRMITLESGMNVSIRRWNSDKWLGTAKNTIHVWRFDPDGLCEPISVRLNLGKNWAEDAYHPLTATIQDSQLEVR